MKTHTREEALKESIQYFNGDELAADVFIEKYAMKNEDLKWLESNPDQMHHRLAKEFARIEKKYPNPISEEEIYGLFSHFKYVVPQGSPMFGIGNSHQRVSLSNCFVINTVDSYGGICRTDERIAQIAKRRGGVGVDISPLRPKGQPTKNSALTTDGIVVFMDRFSNTSREVAQNGRRGALMISISVHHPEILNFIRAKRDLNRVTGANISVRITDEFMKAVQKKETYEQRWPVDSDKPIIKQEVKAREVWDELVKSNWVSAEPGILFWDNIIKNSPADSYADVGYTTVSTNPSLRSDTLILTDKGVFPIKWIAENYSKCKVLNIKKEWKDCSVFKSGDNEQLVKVTFTNSQEIYCTKQHKWPVVNSQGNIFNKQTGKTNKKEAISLKRRDKIYLPLIESPINNKECKFSNEDGFVLGWNQGDGWISIHTGCNDVKQYGFIFGQEDVDNNISSRVLDYTNKLAKKESSLHRDHDSNAYSFSTTDQAVRNKMENIGSCYKKDGVPQTIWEGNDSFVKGYIDGLFSADGYVEYKDKISDCRIVLTSSHEKMIYDVRRLLSFFGIRSLVKKTLSKSCFPKYNSNPEKIYTRFDLFIGTIHAVNFAKIFCLSNKNKQEKLDKIRNLDIKYYENSGRKEFGNKREYLVVKSVELTELREDVYDVTVFDDTHTFLTECGMTGNCGELPLAGNNGSCILLLQNLTSYVVDPFTPKAKFDFELFKKNTRLAQKLIDDMVDLEIEAVSRIIEKVKNDPEDADTKANELSLWNGVKKTAEESRRTGLGITGLGDCIAMLNIKYGSKESLKVVEEIYSTLRDEAYRSSVEMAKERGAFPIWDHKKEAENKFLNRLPEDILKEMKKHGRRNIACLTTSPAGSVSTLTQTTSGFEPVFMAEYKRKRKLTDNDKDKPDFIDNRGDKWKEYTIAHHGLTLFKKITGKEFKDSPYNGAQANEIDHEMRVKMQAVATKYTDHAISSTINLPKETEVKTVEKLYMAAWEEGCKGLTIYRDGCRDGVLTKDSSKNAGRDCEDCNKASEEFSELVKNGFRPEKIVIAAAPKRPEIMPCEIHRSKVGGGDWLFFVGIHQGQPYEVFGGDAEEFPLSLKYKLGWIIKNGKNKEGITQYNLVLDSLDESERTEIKGIAKHFNNKDYGSFTRSISLSLRHGVPIRYVCEQLIKAGCAGDLFSFQRAMSRVLKKYISEGEVCGADCPQCHSDKVIYKNGCPTCQICGHSNCS